MAMEKMTTGRHGRLLSIFAVAEGATGLALLVAPTVVVTLLFGSMVEAPEVLVIGRICGAALLAIATASWGARNDNRSHGPLELLVGLTIYNCLATAILLYTAVVLKMSGVLLWPATFFHAAIFLWCLLVTWRASSDVR
jgi:hypothetical protein